MTVSPLALVDEGLPNSDGVGHTSWATSNEEMFRRILDLYARPRMTIADVTYGKGVFWKLIQRDLYTLHLTDISEGVDCRALPYDTESLDMLVFDPPYRYVERKTVAGHTHEQYRLGTLHREDRPGIDGVLDLYRDGITEASRVVRFGGFLIVKCQDTAGDGKQTWIHDRVMGYCETVGFTPVDMAIVVTASPPPTRWKIQRSLKKAHSYFVVARKGGFYPFGYRSVQSRSAA
jgi:DNA modification methylase